MTPWPACPRCVSAGPPGGWAGDGPHHAREALNRHARRRERAERVALHLARRTRGCNGVTVCRKTSPGFFAASAPEPFALYTLRVFDFGHRIRLLEQPLHGGDADVARVRPRGRTAASSTGMFFTGPTAKVMSDGRQARIAFRSGFDRRVADRCAAHRRGAPRRLGRERCTA